MPAIARHVIAEGRVQGVAFRYYASKKAQALGVRGWVRNLADGRVEAWIEADAGAVEAMLAWLERGPPAARVAGLDVREREPEGFSGFEIERSGR